jgi:ribonucleoside-diphosphate reductase alpha chain
MNVSKRNKTPEPLNLDKIHKMVEIACEDLHNVSPSQVEIRSGLQFYDGITTEEIQDILIRSASDLISLDNPDYQYVAARLLLFSLRKDVFGSDWNLQFPSIKQHLLNNQHLNIYDNSILDEFTDFEFDSINLFIQHDRDFIFTYAGLRQVFDKYLVQDRVTGRIYEIPQFMYILIAMNVYRNEDKSIRLKLIKEYYDLLSEQKINIPTPILANLRTQNKNSVSCVLIDVDDSRDSISHSDVAMGIATSTGSGIGVNAGRLRGIGSSIRNGSVSSNGVIPFLKKFESTIRSWSQGTRGGNCTVNFPIWHQEIEDIIVLKNNKGTDDNRVRKVDYCIQLSKLFYLRYIENKDITLFSPHEVKDLYQAFGLPEFDDLYVAYENNPNVKKTTVSAQKLINDLIKESYETGRVYIMNIDHSNSHSPFINKVFMTNLCVAGDTKIKIGYYDKVKQECFLETIEIQNLGDYLNSEKFENISVRSYDTESKQNKFSPIKAFAQTSPKEKVMKITDEETGKFIIVTPNHQVFTKNRGYVMAKDLNQNDELLISKV